MNTPFRNIAIVLFGLLVTASPLLAQENSDVTQSFDEVSYNARLDGFDYPFPVQTFVLRTQNQELEMAYMYLPAEEDQPVALLLHGKNFSGAYWEETARFLQQRGYGVLMPDQIGFGKSSKPEYYQFGFTQLAYNTERVLENLKINEVIVVGHSMGGMLATRFALLYPDRTKKLILINPIGLEDYLDYVEYKDPQFFYERELKKKPEDIKNYMRKNYYDGEWSPRYDPWVRMQAGWINGPDWLRVAWNNALTYDMLFSQTVYHEFADLTVPTVLIIGTRDRTGPGREWKREGVERELGQYPKLGKEVSQMIPDSTLFELKGLGHLPHIEDFSAFSQPLERVLSTP